VLLRTPGSVWATPFPEENAAKFWTSRASFAVSSISLLGSALSPLLGALRTGLR